MTPAVAAGRHMVREAREVSRMRHRFSWHPVSLAAVEQRL
jgi:hypothetical protein